MPGGQPRLLSKLIQRPLTRPTMLLFAVFCKTSILIPHNGLKTGSVQRCTYNPPSHGQPHPHLSRHNPLQQAHHAFPHVINVTREQNRLSHYPRMGARWSPSERLDKIFQSLNIGQVVFREWLGLTFALSCTRRRK